MIMTEHSEVFFRKNITEYAKSSIKHLCTFSTDTYSAYSLQFLKSQFSIFGMMKIPRDTPKRSFSLKLTIPFSEYINWVDIKVEREKFPKCQEINLLKPKYSLYLNELEWKQNNIFLTKESKYIPSIIFNVKFVHNSTKEAILKIETQMSYSFHNFKMFDVNKDLELLSETHMKFSHYKSHHLFHFYGKINSINIKSITNNVDSVLDILPI